MNNKTNPYVDELQQLLNNYLGTGKYRGIPDIPLDDRIRVNTLMLRRNLFDIEVGLFKICNTDRRISATVSARLMRDVIAKIMRDHCE